MKSEPDEFSIDDLKRAKSAPWTGVRNYQARNFMRDEMKIGDRILFYYSSCEVPGIAGIAKAVSGVTVDATQFDKKSLYYDPRSKKEAPRWLHVSVGFVEKFDRVVTLPELRAEKSLQSMRILQRGNRLSITPVTKTEFKKIMALARARGRD